MIALIAVAAHPDPTAGTIWFLVAALIGGLCDALAWRWRAR